MSRSRKNKNRGQDRHGHQLRQQRERAKIRQDKEYALEEFDLGNFIRQNKILMGVVLIVVCGLIGVKLLRSDQHGLRSLEQSVSAKLEDQSGTWAWEYPFGYKVLALTDQEIFYTRFDTFAKDVRIEWKQLSVTRIKADQLNRSDEKVRIVVPQVEYIPEGVASRSAVTTTMSSQPGMKVVLARFGRFAFVAEIIGDKDGYLFCLFGLKSV